MFQKVIVALATRNNCQYKFLAENKARVIERGENVYSKVFEYNEDTDVVTVYQKNHKPRCFKLSAVMA